MPNLSPRPGRIAAVAAGAVLAALVTAGCHNDAPPSTTVVTTPATAPSTTTAAPGAATAPDTKINTNAGPGASTGTDTALSDAVNTAIVHNKQMTGSRVEPVATAGVVTLNGQVQNQQQKALAEKAASQTPGVSGVKNKLIIVTTGGAKPKPTVITKTVIVHDKAAPSDAGTGDASTPPAVPDASGAPAPPTTPTPPTTPAPPAAPDTGNGAGGGTSNP